MKNPPSVTSEQALNLPQKKHHQSAYRFKLAPYWFANCG